MTLRDFIETYEGFNWQSGEIVVVDQRRAKSYICTCENGKIDHPYMFVTDMFERMLEREVYSWTHTDKTMLITL